jgi:response regulator of citrate/malate metabolism
MADPAIHKLNALIVDPCGESRSRLKQALHHEETAGLLCFQRIITTQSLGEALSILKNDSDFDLLLLAYECGKEAIEQFITEASSMRADKIAFVIVLEPDMQSKFTVAANLVAGVHGMLCAPYSLNTLKQVADITETVRKQNEETRTLRSMPLLVDMMLTQIKKAQTQIAAKPHKKTSNNSCRIMIAQLLKKYPRSAVDAYLNALAEEFEKSAPRKKQVYDGASEILRKKYSGEAEADQPKTSREPEEQPDTKTAQEKVLVIHR